MITKLKDLRVQAETNEDGFTLIELMIVVVIIGILAAIAIPVFANQQKAAIAASVKSDVRNAASEITTVLTKTPTANDIQLATANPNASPDNTLEITGSWDNYQVTGFNATDTTARICFISTVGKISECNTPPAPAALTEAQKADVVAIANSEYSAGQAIYNAGGTQEQWMAVEKGTLSDGTLAMGTTMVTQPGGMGASGVSVQVYAVGFESTPYVIDPYFTGWSSGGGK